MNDQKSPLSRPPRKSSITKAASLLFAGQIYGCTIPDLVGRDPVGYEKLKIKELLRDEPIHRDIVGQLVIHSDVEMTDIWGGTIKSNEVAMDHFDSEVSDNLSVMLREGRIRVFSGNEFFGGVKEDSIAYFHDMPISANTDDGYIFLNTDLMHEWTTGILVHEMLHSSYGGHSDVVKKECISNNTFDASKTDVVECIVSEQDVPYEYGLLFDVAQIAVEKDRERESELFFDIDWSYNPNAVFDALEYEEGETKHEWAKRLAGRTYSVTSTVLDAFGIDRDELVESLENSDMAWEAHQELLAEIRLEVEKEYLAEAQAELQEQERQQEANEEIIEEGLEEMSEVPESRFEEESRDGYRLNRS